MTIKINISTCPNDTFMFDALLHNKIDTKGYRFELHMADIAELNTIVKEECVDVSKISYAVYPQIEDNYQILNSGSAMGRGNGPLLVSKKKIYADEIKDLKIAVPGLTTTANMLLTIGFGDVKERKEYLFSDISSAVEADEVDAGILIHEERFCYKKMGLQLISDLGQMWEDKKRLLIPLGAIVVRRDLDENIKKDIQELIAESIRFAFENPQSSLSFVKQNAQELDDEIIEKHIKMFVNDFSINVGEVGKESVKGFFEASGVTLKNKIFV